MFKKLGTKKILPFYHIPGRHCASTSIRDIVAYHGISMSEPMCFGIGQGLGIWYVKGIPNAPSILFHLRSLDLESCFFKNFNIPFEFEQFDNPNDAIMGLIQKINQEIPVLVQTDIYYLPYFNSSTHFPGHAIVVWGYDLKNKTFFVSDTERSRLVEVEFSAMKKALYFPLGFFKGKGNQFGTKYLKLPEDMDEVIKKSIVKNSLNILDPKIPYSGILALDSWISEYEAWSNFKDWQWCSRFTYQIIEKRGTGGGGFRLMYSKFLREASHYLNILKTRGLPDLMKQIGFKWREIAYCLKDISEKDIPDFRPLAPLLKKVRNIEYQYHSTIIDLFL